MAVRRRQRLAVPLVSEQRPCFAGLVKAEAAFVADRRIATLDEPAIRALERKLRCAAQRAFPFDHLDQGDARPFGGADGTQAPLLTGGRRIEQATSVAGALKKSRRSSRNEESEGPSCSGSATFPPSR